ncbi:monovalent cation/H(+) antiporter subunit G [Brachybacterium sp. MASK1Z-5]|uniref:Monovalent cation/H(+) antiporter subunit G n=1 Tax=Brachybacterium halotolerans TaxID=2795215 RepID=A0ABS1BBB4_9MICO|nr:monovalent cation/H(+) antiporter subunit G [Brachybacterium halotolerans]MBK0331954.1 monovalent cation/H(+) antiporter subunit G [Brachybacterium halotolerans]
MSAMDVIGLVLIALGALFALVASIGLERFSDVLRRMHAVSKPQTVGLLLVLAGTALIAGSWTIAGSMLLVMLAQMATVTVSSTMVGRAAFRRGFVSGSAYTIDELTPRLASTFDEDDDEDGFVDESQGPHLGEEESPERFPENVVGGAHEHADLSNLSNWDEPEDESGPTSLDVDIDLEDETEKELEDVVERRGRDEDGI